jgi:hypothetical protein
LTRHRVPPERCHLRHVSHRHLCSGKDYEPVWEGEQVMRNTVVDAGFNVYFVSSQ